jgi:hypothetical protein
MGCREAIRRALGRILENQVDTCWQDAGELAPPEWAYCGDSQWAGGTILECGYRARIQATPDELWDPLVKMGGPQGYYYGTFLWQIRGVMDRLIGGRGICGRRDTCELRPGDTLDFFRVQEATRPDRLMLVATMKVPGEAILDMQLTPIGDHITEISLMARFLPKGIGGIAYWYSFYPFHLWLFAGMLKAIAENIGKPLVSKPERFTSTQVSTCSLPVDKYFDRN